MPFLRVRLSLHLLSTWTSVCPTNAAYKDWVASMDKYYPDGDTKFCNDRHLAAQAILQPVTWSLPESSFW
jgi:hypothetical protein